MRVCLFSPELRELADSTWGDRVRASLGPGRHDLIAVTNSWADVDPGADIYTTAAARTTSMRLLRRSLAGGPVLARATAAALRERVSPALVEALRAADPDLVVCSSEACAEQLRVLLPEPRRWPIVHELAGSSPAPLWRHYDPDVTVSIVLPTHNGTRFLRESMASCLDQTHRRIELIVVDDGSTAATREIVEACRDPRIVFVRHDENRGLPASLNTGFRRSTGTLLTWTSDDNRYMPDAIEQMVRALQTYPDVDFVYADSYRIDATGAIDPRDVLRTRAAESLREDNFIGACFLYTRAVYEAIGEYDSRAVLAEDYDYWVRVSERFRMQRLFRTLYCYRFHDRSLTARHTRAEIAARVAAIRQQHQREAWS